MPGRNHQFQEGSYYHIYDKTIDGRRPFESARNAEIFLRMMWYYRAEDIGIRHSRFIALREELQAIYNPAIEDPAKRQVQILAYCLMPTHYHLLIKEKMKGGISAYMSKLQNAFTRFYNTKLRRSGQIFLGHFKSKPLTSEDMFRHVARYIHLNPYSSGIVENTDELVSYPLSSLREHTIGEETNTRPITDFELLLDFFGGDNDRYIRFVLDNAEHQKTLEYCKYINKLFSNK